MERGAPSVEVVVIFDGAIQAVRHLVHPAPGFTVGDQAGADFPLAGAGARVREAGGGYELVFSAGVEGAMVAGGERATLAELIATGAARPEGDEYFCAVPTGARASVALGAVELVVSSSLPPRRRALGPRPDLVQLAMTAATAALFSTAALLLLAIPPEPRVDFLQIAPAFQHAHIIFPALAAKPSELPWWLFTRASRPIAVERGREPAPARAATRTAVAIPAAPAPRRRDDLRRAAAERAEGSSVLRILAERENSQIGSIFGRDSALGPAARAALDGLTGGGGAFDSAELERAFGGAPGLGAWGGGGTTGDTIGLGRIGTIGRGNGGADSHRYGRSVGLLRRDSASVQFGGAPELVPCPHKASQTSLVSQCMSPDPIRRVVRRHLNQIRFCYEQALERRDGAAGRVVTSFIIGKDGRVAAAAVTQSQLDDPAAERCMADAIRGWEFPKPPGGGVAQVSYPFTFASIEGGKPPSSGKAR